MAGRKKENFKRGRVEFKAEPAWIRRVFKESELGGYGNISSFIRAVVTAHMERVEEVRSETAKANLLRS